MDSAPDDAVFLTDRRRERIRNALNNRTRRLTVLLEDIYDPLNASAVLRTADGLGIQDIHIAENRHAFSVHSKVSGRAAAWLTINHYRAESGVQKQDFRIRPSGVQLATEAAYSALKNAGYTIIATSPRTSTTLPKRETEDGRSTGGKSVSLRELDISKKYAVALGSEHWGLSDWAIDNADLSMALPMLGFTESYNISVTAAMILHFLADRLRSETSDWQLSEGEKEIIWREWTRLKK